MAFTDNYAAQEPARADVDALPGLTLLEFGAPWCPICQGAQPMLAEALAPHPGVRHIKIEDGRGKPLGRSFAVRLWPTVVLLRDGFVMGRWVRPHNGAELVAALAGADAGT
ncbi:MAG: thioredoxin family protein [Arenimonas sp.]